MTNEFSNQLNFRNIASYRNSMQLNQTAFWRLFGCTQSGGCRYESGREMPDPVVLLLILHAQRKITDDDLKQADRLRATQSIQETST